MLRGLYSFVGCTGEVNSWCADLILAETFGGKRRVPLEYRGVMLE